MVSDLVVGYASCSGRTLADLLGLGASAHHRFGVAFFPAEGCCLGYSKSLT